jgi:aminoglycoside/choline kinase family phosphotransferase
MGSAVARTMIPPDYAHDFLASCGWQGAEILPLAGDASFRRYFRVRDGERSAVLMDAPPPHEDPRPFVAVAEYLASVGLSAPQILARDLDKGMLLLGDFGDWRLRERLDSDPERERELYEHATDVLVHLHRHPPMPGLRPHAVEQWLTEVELFLEWYCPTVGADVDAEGYRAAWTEALSPVAADGLSPVTVLRDYHAENIMLVGGLEGVRHFGLLDFQDAVAGHPAYDLASVLEDARRDVPPAIERAMIDRYVAAGDGRPAQHANPRSLHAAVEARQQARLSPLPAAHVGPARARPCPAASRSGQGLVRCQHRPRAPLDRVARGGVSSTRRSLRLRAECSGQVPHTAMIMAAGLGKRMRPLTATRPKPLIEVGGKPLLDHVLDRLRAAGVTKVVVNVHYLADAVESHLATRKHGLDVIISDERKLLMETGGGLVQAEPLIDCDPFLAINSDNMWVDGPADTLRRAQNHRGTGDFHMDRSGRLRRRRKSHVAPFVFTGVQMLSKRLLRDPPDGPFSTNLLWDRAIEEGRCFGAVHQGLWFDVGTPASIDMTEAALENA